MLISPQWLASDTIDMREAVHAATDEDRVNSRRRETKSRSDLGWPQSKPPAQVDDLLLDMLGRPAWDPVRLAGAILHPRLTLFPVAACPFPGSDRGDHEHLGVVCGRGRNPTLRLWPAIFSGEIDVFPSERRNMGQEIGR